MAKTTVNIHDAKTNLSRLLDRAAASLDHPHRDPFDRMLAAQTRIGGFTLLSRGPYLSDIGIDLLW